MREWSIVVPHTLTLLNANDRSHWSVRWRRSQALREWACVALRGVPQQLTVEVVVVVHPGSRTKRFDPANWAPTAKACIDGIVDAGVVLDDDAQHVTRVSYEAGERKWKTTVELRIVAGEPPGLPPTG